MFFIAKKGFASITGAWIETPLTLEAVMLLISRPSRARGLKPYGESEEQTTSIRVHHGRVD